MVLNGNGNGNVMARARTYSALPVDIGSGTVFGMYALDNNSQSIRNSVSWWLVGNTTPLLCPQVLHSGPSDYYPSKNG